jgi:hypothetical protein
VGELGKIGFVEKVLFLGEGGLAGPARYLGAFLKYARLPFDHVDDQVRIPEAWFKRHYSAIVLSDYRYACWTPAGRRWLIDQVNKGTGLLMIGGWGSFTGLVGGYAGMDIENLLPVRCIPKDDRVNRAAVLIGKKLKPVMVCGYNKARPKPGTNTAMVFRHLDFKNGSPRLGAQIPALVLGQHGKGRTAAFLTDCAPHWAGELVDWGRKRVSVKVAPGNVVEVGDLYLKFFRQLLYWTTGQLPALKL